tara:strand:+ start:398 stop:637 length:240 start_codon:yes stop_codon:yes gene_type:complete
MAIDIFHTCLLIVGLLGLAWFIRGELSKIVISMASIQSTLEEMQTRLDAVNRAAQASHRRLDTLEKDLLRVKILQEHLH